MKIYKCNTCGKVVMSLNDTSAKMVCDGQEMVLLTPNSVDAAVEKHVPVIETNDNGYLVKVGSVPHPMEPDHYIMWVCLVADGVLHFKYLEPAIEPNSVFEVPLAQTVEAYAFCNLHGLWKS